MTFLDVFLISLLVILPLQMWLCEKGKKLFLRLLPVIVFAVLTVGLLLLTPVIGSVACLLAALCAAIMLFVSIAGWYIWSVWDSQRNRKNG